VRGDIVTSNDTRLDYQRIPPDSFPPAQAGVGVASLVVAGLLSLLAIVLRMDILESLSMQFYFYSLGFITSFALGIWGLFVRNRRRAAAVMGLGVSVMGFAWKVSSLYISMQSWVANGWMTMPWPLR
jgi:hypothetical protein